MMFSDNHTPVLGFAAMNRMAKASDEPAWLKWARRVADNPTGDDFRAIALFIAAVFCIVAVAL
jgi:hypothetical protein